MTIRVKVNPSLLSGGTCLERILSLSSRKTMSNGNSKKPSISIEDAEKTFQKHIHVLTSGLVTNFDFVIMVLPVVEPEDYPPARCVVFECCTQQQGNDGWEDPRYVTTHPAYLAAMKVADQFFAHQLFEDKALHSTYEKMRRSCLSKRKIAKDPSLKSQILTIERALKNRMDFATQQKIYALEQLIFIHCETEKERIKKEADDEIKVVHAIVKQWKSDSMEDKLDEFVQTASNLLMY